MTASLPTRCIAFAGIRRIASGEVKQVALAVKELTERGAQEPVLIFHETTSEPVELDLRGTPEEVLQRLAAGTDASASDGEVEEAIPSRGPGRPRLGVVGREVTLLPRHWDWLNRQPGGASVALRRLVESARRSGEERDRRRQAQESAYRFLSAMAGNLPGFEEATRALFAGNRERFQELTAPWPADIRDHARALATGVFAPV